MTWELGGGLDLALMAALGAATAAGWLSVTARAAAAAKRDRPNRALSAAGLCGAVTGAALIVVANDSMIPQEWTLALAGGSVAVLAVVLTPALAAWGLRRAWSDADAPAGDPPGADLSALDAPPAADGPPKRSAGRE